MNRQADLEIAAAAVAQASIKQTCLAGLVTSLPTYTRGRRPHTLHARNTDIPIGSDTVEPDTEGGGPSPRGVRDLISPLLRMHCASILYVSARPPRCNRTPRPALFSSMQQSSHAWAHASEHEIPPIT